MGLRVLGNRHLEGLTEKKLLFLSWDKLKAGFENVGICHSKEEIRQYVQTKKVMPGILDDSVNKLKLLATPAYYPMIDLQPRFKIWAAEFEMNQRLELLEIAHRRGIILEFNDYFSFIKPDKIDSLNLLPSLKDRKSLMNAHGAFECSFRFLKDCFEKDVENINLNLINAQLRALGFKLGFKNGKILRPTVYLEENKVVVISGNGSEIPNPEKAIELLAPHVNKFKINVKGLLYIEDLKLYNKDKLYEFKTKLDEKYPDKIWWIEDDTDINNIWQEGFIPFEESVKAEYEQYAEIKAILKQS